MTPAIVAPSDVGTLRGARLRLGGRVIGVEEGAFLLADAFATVRLAGSADVAAGDLVVCDVKKSARGLALEAVVERHRPATPAADAGEARRLVHEGVGANLVARARVVSLVRAYFDAERFVEVETPLLVPSPGLDLHLDAVGADGGFLITSPEYQMKRLLVGGVPRLFQLAHVLRKRELGARHNPEFTMLEWYRAFAPMDAVVADTEQLVAGIATAFADRPVLVVGGRELLVEPPFERMAVAEAFHRFAGVGADEALALADEDEERFYRLLVDRVEPALAALDRPVFLVDYPASQASLARRKADDPRVCERFELYVAGVELCNGFGELTDPVEQRARFDRDQRARAAQGKPVYPKDERFLAALEEGMPPSAGNALGLDRLVALVLGEAEIARTMAFPAGWL